jgi:hypothetical protein
VWLLYEIKKYAKTSGMSDGKMVMYRQEVIDLMTSAINDMNRKRGVEAGVREDELDQAIGAMSPELNNVNAMLYDLLVDNGVIRS